MLCVSILLSASPTVKRLPVCVVTSKTCLPRIAQVSRSKNFLSRWRARLANSNYSSSANMAPPDVSASVTPLPRHGKRRRLVEDVAAGRTSLGPGPANAGDPVGNKEGASHAGMATFPLGLAKGFESAELRLMEATPEVLDALGQGANLRVVGDGLEHPAALVTETATFEMCRVETSNLLLLFPPIEKGGDIGTAAGNVSFHYELKRSKPKQQLLRQLLGEGRVWSLDELETRVQGSRAEVLALLRQMNALQVDGAGKRWRAVSEEKEVSPILDRLLTELMARGKSLEGVAEEDCVALLPDVETVLVQHCLKAYGDPHSLPEQDSQQSTSVERVGPSALAHGPLEEGSIEAALEQSRGRRWTLNLGKVAAFKAHQIFQQGMSRPQGAVWTREAFLLEWEARLPGLYRPDPEVLRGIALKEEIGGEACLRYLPGVTMPLDPTDRLKRLFTVRKKWRFEEMEPYMLPLVPEKKTLEDFLLKHTRSSVEAGEGGGRIYSAR